MILAQNPLFCIVWLYKKLYNADNNLEEDYKENRFIEFFWGGSKTMASDMNSNDFEKAVEKATGRSFKELQEIPLDEMRNQIEECRKRPITYKAVFPLIGRGNVLSRNAVSHANVLRIFKAAVR